MNKQQKGEVIEALKEKFNDSVYFYIADSSELTVETINQFRRTCFENDIEVKVVKNTLVQKALESFDAEKNYEPLYDVLKGPTTLLFSDVANKPARIIEEFRKTNDKPVLKAAYIETGIYLGDDQIETLSKLKSKDELLGEIIGLLQSPAQNVVSALKSGGNTIAGLVKALEERAN